ncbi:MAG TPA: lytic transglycosylase domain-containing protein [Syntrophomonadaceae bacterium]|nr:lytic transglycosylase domain-containing protein [Syntrophomonadaceae bacterium]
MSSLLSILSEFNLLKILELVLEKSSMQNLAGISINKTVQQNGTAGQSRPFSEIIKEASQRYGINENVISAVIKQESSFNPRAVSSCGASGLMQLMPSTAKGLGVSDIFDPEQNIMCGTMYLKEKLDEFHGSLPLALAAYNAGSTAVKKYGGIPPYKETQAYVNNIIKSVDRYA